ncbi:MAG: hypothetical protein Q9225_005383 [Loekoesia sp. 1 TL-2023]
MSPTGSPSRGVDCEGETTSYDFIRFYWETNFIRQTPPQHQCRPYEPPTSEERDIIEACAAGDIDKIKPYLERCNIREPEHPDYDPSHPPRYDFFRAAILHKKSSLLEYLLKCFPHIDLTGDVLLEAALQNPDLDTFRVIHSHNSGVVNHEYNPIRNILMESCCGGDPLIPSYLLDHGVNPEYGGLGGHGGPLDYAVQHGQPIEIIKKMVEHGAYIRGRHQCMALYLRRLDVLELLLARGSYDPHGKLLEQARETGDTTIIAMVEKRAKNLTRHEQKLASGPKEHRKKAGKTDKSLRIFGVCQNRFEQLRRYLFRTPASP